MLKEILTRLIKTLLTGILDIALLFILCFVVIAGVYYACRIFDVKFDSPSNKQVIKEDTIQFLNKSAFECVKCGYINERSIYFIGKDECDGTVEQRHCEKRLLRE